MKVIYKLAALCLCAAMLVGCAANSQVKDIGKSVQAAGIDAIGVADQGAVAKLGCELIAQSAAQPGDNLAISPLSAYTALAMLISGADGETLAGFEALLGGDSQYVNSLVYGAWNKLLAASGQSFAVNGANSVWVDTQTTANDAWISTVKAYFNADIYSAELSGQAALDAINAWAKDKTDGKISQLRNSAYQQGTAMVLLNALCMDAQWRYPFDVNATRERIFNNAGGTASRVPFMAREGESGLYIKTDDAEGILMPYKDSTAALLAIKPNDGDARAYAASMDADKLKALIDASELITMDLYMPKFSVSCTNALDDALIALGLGAAYSADADFSLLGSRQNGNSLCLSSVMQKVRIDVDEAGTQAAAVTEIVMDECAALLPEDIVSLNFDTPFAYAIIELDSALPLFLGTVETLG